MSRREWLLTLAAAAAIVVFQAGLFYVAIRWAR
jgi:hypothetical protein